MRVPFTWLQELVDCKRQTAAQVGHLLTMAGLELEQLESLGPETVLEIAVTPNRADALSITGMAREVAAITKARMRPVASKPLRGKGKIADTLTVKVHDAKRCPRYAARRIDGVRIAPSPLEVQQRLIAAGIRPINNAVDATNYVMWELGQPLHAFDARTLRDQKIVVRTAQPQDTTFITLDGATRKLCPDDLLICDGQGPVALAGIMGGANSEVSATTTSIILESAYFAPLGIRRTSKRLGLTTESSRRFERGVDPAGVVHAMQRAVTLMCAWAGGVPSQDWLDHYPKRINPIRIALPVHEVVRVLGIQIRRAAIIHILKRLGCGVQGSGEVLRVIVPTFRPDLERPIDLIEEIARIYGYDRIEPEVPALALAPVHRPAGWHRREQCLERLHALGFHQAVHYAFESSSQSENFRWPGSEPLTITNPLGQEQAYLKTSLSGGLVEAAARNIRNGQLGVRLCELRPVVHADGPKIGETLRLAGIIFGPRYPQGWTAPQDVLDFFDIKGLVEMLSTWMGMEHVNWDTASLPSFLHPGRSGWAFYRGRRIGCAGELHPSLTQRFEFPQAPYLFECDFESFVEPSSLATYYQPLARHPGVRRDVSMLVDHRCPAQQIHHTIVESGESWITEVQLFDCYQGDRLPPGKKSLAYAIHYQHPERTLTDEEVNASHARVMQRLVDVCGVEIRQ